MTHAPVAQQEEQRSTEPYDGGSSPSGCLAEWACQESSRVDGSFPPASVAQWEEHWYTLRYKGSSPFRCPVFTYLRLHL